MVTWRKLRSFDRSEEAIGAEFGTKRLQHLGKIPQRTREIFPGAKQLRANTIRGRHDNYA
jgi:hypothetical protein